MSEIALKQVPVMPLSRTERVRAAVLSLFREPAGNVSEMLYGLTSREWKELLHWLDTSGLALYALDRVDELGASELLPDWVRSRLEQNLRDNSERTAAMIEECCAIQREFAAAKITYVVVKGFSLWPHSVARFELRSQLDLDFLVSSVDAPRAQSVLERRGYRLHAFSGQSRELKTPHPGSASITDLYKAPLCRTVELHLEEPDARRLTRCEHHALRDVSTPVLQAADLFLDQVLHLYKHLSRDHLRASHLVEIYRHLRVRKNELLFWEQVKALCSKEGNVAQRVALVLDLVSQQIEPHCVSPLIRHWFAVRASEPARIWVHRYGARIVTASFPGTKLHLLLQEPSGSGGTSSRSSIMASLLPHRLPPQIAVPPVDETLPQEFVRRWRQAMYIASRSRFHAVEGMRYLLERHNLQRILKRASEASRKLQHALKTQLEVATKP